MRTTRDMDVKASKKYMENVKISDIIKAKNITSDLTSSRSHKRDHRGAKMKLEILGKLETVLFHCIFNYEDY